MRVVRLDAVAYGLFRDWRCAPAPGLTVFLGRNESGKSTARDALVTLLFGFDPARAERHPYRPWPRPGDAARSDEGRLVVRGEIALDAGGRLEVERVLGPEPRGSVVLRRADGEASRFRLRNQPLAEAGRLGRELYESCFAVAAADLRMFRHDAWEALEGLLLGDAGEGGFERTARVIENLRKEADQLWRPDRVGNPEARRLREEVEKVQEELREARKRAELAREALARAEAARQARDELRERKAELSARRERLARLREAEASLARIDGLRARAGDPALLEGLPADPVAELDRLEAEVVRLGQESAGLRERRAALAARAALAEADRAVIALEGVLGRALRAADALARLREEAAEASAAARGAREAARAKAQAFLAAGAEVPLEELEVALRRIPAAEVEARAAGWEEAAGEARSRREKLAERRAVLAELAARERRDGRGRPAAVAAEVGLAAFGAAMVVLGALRIGGSAWLGVGLAAVGAAALGAAAFLLAREARRGDTSPEDRLAADLAPYAAEADAAAQRAEEAAQRAREAVAALPLAPALLEAPGLRLAQAVLELRSAVGEWRQAELRRDGCEASLRIAESEIREAARALIEAGAMPEGLPEADAWQVALALRARLEAAREAERQARAAAAQLETLDEALARAGARLAEAAAQRERLLDRLRPFAEDPRAAAHEARERAMALQAARQLEEALAADPGKPPLDELRREVAEAVRAGELPWTDERRQALDVEIERLEAEERAAEAEYLKQNGDYLQLGADPTPDEVAGRLAAIREAYAAVCRERDRLALLLAVVRRAEAAFREVHRPEVLRLASHHLARFTEGRYDRLDLVDPPDDEAERRAWREALADGERPQKARSALVVSGPAVRAAGDGWLAAAPPLSQGTLHQVHLALRLALVEHLDESGERLPVLLDDPLVHWDRGRREAALRWLCEWSGGRQVLFFTCHEPVAREAQAAGATVIEI